MVGSCRSIADAVGIHLYEGICISSGDNAQRLNTYENTGILSNLFLAVHPHADQLKIGPLGNSLDRTRASESRGVTVTDLKWRALGRSWLGAGGGSLDVDRDEICARLGAAKLYLAVCLSRAWQGEFWPLVVGVHLIPDYEATVDWSHI